MQKANSPHKAARKHLSPELSGKCSATICQLENNLLLIYSREHLFSWKAGVGQRQLPGTLVINREVSSAGDVKETQILCSMQHGIDCMTLVVTYYMSLSLWLAGRIFPRKLKSLALWCPLEDGDCQAGLGPQEVLDAALWGWSCWWPYLQGLWWS